MGGDTLLIFYQNNDDKEKEQCNEEDNGNLRLCGKAC